jgi:hypothetical protein
MPSLFIPHHIHPSICGIEHVVTNVIALPRDGQLIFLVSHPYYQASIIIIHSPARLPYASRAIA